jgi:Arc/MetJ family transcription regulator
MDVNNNVRRWRDGRISLIPYGHEAGWETHDALRNDCEGSSRAWAEPTSPWIYMRVFVYTAGMAKHLVDLDDAALSAARAELGTTTIKDTVNEALRRATAERAERIRNALDVLANAPLDDREDAWR